VAESVISQQVPPSRYNIKNRQRHIVTCKGLACRIMVGSGFDDWVYWHFFTTTFDYNRSRIELLNDVCLTNLCEKSLTVV
jgi:hypothetical protein